MNPARKLIGYTRSPDGMYRRRVEFDVHGRPEIVNVVYLVRAPSGELRKSETVGWRYKKEQLTASTH